jgi:hypothetical protein
MTGFLRKSGPVAKQIEKKIGARNRVSSTVGMTKSWYQMEYVAKRLYYDNARKVVNKR